MQREREEWRLSSLKYFVIITPKKIRVYLNSSNQYANVHSPDLVFDYTREKRQFLEFLKSDKSKIKIELFLEEIFLDLYANNKIEHLAIIKMLIHFDEPISFITKGIIINQGENNEYIIDCEAQTLDFAKALYAKYYTEDTERIKENIRHNWSSYQIDSKKSSLGKYYTPIHLIDIVKNYADAFLGKNPDTYVLDSCAGCGSFLEAFKKYNIIGRDFDGEAVEILKELGYKNIEVDNSLINSGRQKYKLKEQDKLIIVGNPPYNDTTSKNKRFGTNKKQKVSFDIDGSLGSKDYGISFLKHYATLEPQEIIVLHPLSYLIKRTNFNSLGFFASTYKLIEATIFSSKEFGNSIDKSRTPFPIVCAKYCKGKMVYNDIKEFSFDILNSQNKFKLNKFYTIDDYGIRKYPTKNSVSDIGLYHYNIRDANSLITSGNISETNDCKNYITIMFNTLYQYCYLQCYRRYFPGEMGLTYLVGNLSPLCNKDSLNDETFRDICVMDTLFAQRKRIKAFDKANENSFIYTKFLINSLRRRAESHSLYKSFLNYFDKDYDCEEDFQNFFKAYFLRLLETQLGFSIGNKGM